VNKQLLPFEPQRLARSRDPETSHMAATASRDLRARHHSAILAALRTSAIPMSAEDIAYLDGTMDRVQVGRRICEMVEGGLIEPAGEKVISTGRRARCFQVRP